MRIEVGDIVEGKWSKNQYLVLSPANITEGHGFYYGLVIKSNTTKQLFSTVLLHEDNLTAMVKWNDMWVMEDKLSEKMEDTCEKELNPNE